MTCTLTPRPDGLALQSPYDPAFVAAFKALVPGDKRRWDGARKVWLVDPSQAGPVADLCATFFGARPDVPVLATVASRPEIRTIQLEYLGATKVRDLGAEPTAMGYASGAWSVIAPERVLKAWFDPFGGQADQVTPDAPQTLYGLLGVPQRADADALKTAYRRMARQWHPDVCREPGAAEMFVKLKAAYDVLGDPLKRRKYDAGLLFEAQQERPSRRSAFSVTPATLASYRAPLRCGLLVAEALPKLGRLTLTKILAWNDITDGAGRVMVASWDSDAERIRVEWVTP
jgi:DnaJ-domain-containing protein 1